MMDAALVIFILVSIVLWIGAELWALSKRRSRNRWRVDRVEPQCERAGSQQSFNRQVSR